jgi:hypothetical protein
LRLSTGYNNGFTLSESLYLASICDRAGTAWGVDTYTDEHCNFLPDTSCFLNLRVHVESLQQVVIDVR